ncbi:MAG: inorganic phosphate transporter [Gammaproteobacteria bacterium]
MTSGQGLVGNLATSALVIGASRLGLPVSTTHVSTGAIFGIGGAVGRIVSAWITALPLAAVLAAALKWGQRWL